MTEQHPIVPPMKLVREWNDAAIGTDFRPYGYSEYIAVQAARWGADQELEACCQWLNFYAAAAEARDLRLARRPKPPSLAEQALTLLDDASTRLDAAHENTIRRALERLEELENNG